jgi:uncharacterized membrane protein YfcA
LVKSIISGGLVGFTLGLIGGGGSILAVPLLVYFVGYAKHPHTAVGTTAVAVAVNALIAIVPHVRGKTVQFQPGIYFALAGILGAALGSKLGLMVEGGHLLFLFALLMLVISVLMWRRGDRPQQQAQSTDTGAGFPFARVFGTGFVVGAASGFFGIGGGFLVVPGLIASAGLSTIAAVGTSLLSVFAFGATTAIQYALAGKVDVGVAALFIVGGMLGGMLGAAAGRKIGSARLGRVFSAVLVVIAIYMMVKQA